MPSLYFAAFFPPVGEISGVVLAAGAVVLALFKRPGPPGQARVISHLVKITDALNAPVPCCECQRRHDWQLDGGGSICMAFSQAGNASPRTPLPPMLPFPLAALLQHQGG